MRFPVMNIRLPDWVEQFMGEAGESFPNVEDRMGLAVALSRRNVEEKTGGPFAAAVFDGEGKLIAPGVNMVTSSNCSVLHAEIVAVALAQNVLGRYDIGDAGRLDFDLVATTEPCAMCFGAVPWSGVNRLICGARDADARAIGFDEGPKLSSWVAELESRGITVVRDVLRQPAVDVLQTYLTSGGTIYNTG
ncbi:MAG: nucleoside deaminase [Desulfobacteraceae bacterium]|nr:nucleoside deaminase [Desulfobacteraceae bacterium]